MHKQKRWDTGTGRLVLIANFLAHDLDLGKFLIIKKLKIVCFLI